MKFASSQYIMTVPVIYSDSCVKNGPDIRLDLLDKPRLHLYPSGVLSEAWEYIDPWELVQIAFLTQPAVNITAN